MGTAFPYQTGKGKTRKQKVKKKLDKNRFADIIAPYQKQPIGDSMKQTNIFGEEEETGKKEPTMYLGIYDQYEVVSSLVKSIRLGLVEDALYWLEVMVKGGAGLSYVVRRLMIESQESGFGAEPAIYAAAVGKIVELGRDHAKDAVFQLTVYLCKCKKWWEDEDTRKHLKTWYAMEKKVIAIKKREAKPVPIPAYALDRHTKRGNQMLREGKKIDERFSGSEKGIFSMMTLYEKYGRLNKDEYLTDDEERKMRKFLYES